jgi:hypothetical protein
VGHIARGRHAQHRAAHIRYHLQHGAGFTVFITQFIDRRSQHNQIGLNTVSMFGDDLARFSGGYSMLHRHGMGFVERRKKAQMLKMFLMR